MQTIIHNTLLHSIATPINAILLESELALNQLPPEAYHSRSSLHSIHKNSLYLREIIKKGNSTSKIQQFFPKLALREIIILSSQRKKEYLFNYQDKISSALELHGNKFLFQELFLSLINNAAESYKKKQSNKIILIHASTEKKSLIITVTDGGRGMNSLEKRLAFENGFSLKDQSRGQGLHLCKKIVEQNFHGKITILSKKNRGSSIHCQFPLSST